MKRGRLSRIGGRAPAFLALGSRSQGSGRGVDGTNSERDEESSTAAGSLDSGGMKVVASHHGLRAVALLRHLVASCLPAMVGAVLISLSPALVLDYAGGRLAPVAHLSPGLSSSQGTPGRLPKRTVDDRGHAAAFEALSPAGAKTSPVVSMCQIASARRRARSTRATFFPRWRPRRRAMYW